jgi:hypothetical protein
MDINPENLNKPATDSQILYLQGLIAYSPQIKFPEGTKEDFIKSAKQLVKKKIESEIGDGLTRERASKLIDAMKTGFYGHDQIFKILNIKTADVCTPP